MPRLRRSSEATYREDAAIVGAMERIVGALMQRHPKLPSLPMAGRMLAEVEKDLLRKAAISVTPGPAAPAEDA